MSLCLLMREICTSLPTSTSSPTNLLALNSPQFNTPYLQSMGKKGGKEVNAQNKSPIQLDPLRINYTSLTRPYCPCLFPGQCIFDDTERE